ncbi:MAG TPA: DUF4032 domain-containing protein [Nitriliruptorales bacterium]|nr:DUF4032 domain-containing protein [Nitriliruptorales bacterium]
MRFQLTARTGHPDFLDLPWNRPLVDWTDERLVEVARGLHRHVVRFVNLAGTVYALKELRPRLAEREYRLLRHLAEESLPVVDVVGVVSGRATARGEPLDAILMTRHLPYALPYRALFARARMPDVRRHLLDALAGLLVRLHLAGFFWGDCSLSNSLFRRDAGALAAYLVDAETAELHYQLTNGQRLHDLEIAQHNIAGELLDVQAELGLDVGLDPLATSEELAERYAGLWSELTREETFAPDERYRVDARLRRLNELGFDVEEVQLVSVDGGYQLRLSPRVVEPGHHRRRLLSMTGLDVQENQARRLLNDLAHYRAQRQDEEGPLPDPVIAYRWMTEVFERAIAQVPSDLRGKREPAELFHELLEHKYLRSQAAGRDIGLVEATRSYVEKVLRYHPDERGVFAD